MWLDRHAAYATSAAMQIQRGRCIELEAEALAFGINTAHMSQCNPFCFETDFSFYSMLT